MRNELSKRKYLLLILSGILLISISFSESRIRILSPNGGEELPTSSNQVIQWQGSGKTGSFVNIYFSANQGVNWEKINFTQDDGSYVWEIPNSGYTNCIIKIEDFRNPEIFDISDEPFIIAGPSILVVRPGPDDALESRKTFEVEWQGIDLTSSSVKIFYSLDDGTNWELVTNKTKNTGRYTWHVPDIYGTINQCLIRVEEFGNASLYDKSDGNFTILGVEPTIRITYPQIESVLAANKTYKVTWESRHLRSDFVKLYFSTNNGISWKKLSSFTPNEGSINWTTPDETSEDCLIRIEDAGDNKTFAISEGNFTVSKKPNIKMNSPSGGMELEPGVLFNISWESMNLSSDEVNIYYSLNGGTNWLSIAYEAKDTASFNWLVPEFDSNQNECVVKVEDVGNSEVFSENEEVFVILGVPLIELMYPIGGELFPSNTTEVIQWRSSNLKDDVITILLSGDGGMMWEVLVDDVPDVGIFDLTVPEITSTKSLIKIESPSDPGIFDQTDRYLHLTADPLILIDSPITGDKWMPGGMQMIRWRSFNLPGNKVNIYYSMDNGLNWINLATKITNSGNYPLTTPTVMAPTNNAQIKLEDYSDQSASFISTGNFSIIAPPIIQIIHPNGGDIVPTNMDYSISWNSYNDVGKYVNLYFSLNGGNKWKKIKSDVPNNGNYTWKTPELKSTNGEILLKIRDSYNASTYDESDAVFTLKIPDPGITIYRPLISESIASGKIFNIEWTSVSLSGKGVNLYYSTDNGNKWEDIGEFLPDEGNFRWDVPKLPVLSDVCQIMLQDAGSHTVVEISDNFTIGGYPSFTVLSPGSGETITTGSEQKIVWESNNISGNSVNLYYSDDGGEAWRNISQNISNTGSYTWNMENVSKSTTNAKIKIEAADDKSIFNITTTPFSIRVLNSVLTISTPNGGEKLTMGESVSVNWSSKELFSSKVDMYYSINGGMKWNVIKKNIPDNGSFNWKIPKLKKISSNCLIKMVDSGNNTITDVSDAKFAIKLPSTIKITTPNGGERLKTKKGVYIAWDASKMPGEKVNIYYSIDDGNTWVEIKNNNPNSGSIIWKVPNTKSKKCLVKVENVNDIDDFDISDKNFTIR